MHKYTSTHIYIVSRLHRQIKQNCPPVRLCHCTRRMRTREILYCVCLFFLVSSQKHFSLPDFSFLIISDILDKFLILTLKLFSIHVIIQIYFTYFFIHFCHLIKHYKFCWLFDSSVLFQTHCTNPLFVCTYKCNIIHLYSISLSLPYMFHLNQITQQCTGATRLTVTGSIIMTMALLLHRSAEI